MAEMRSMFFDGHMPPHGQILGRPSPERARQFMPFAALRGYYDLIRERERVPEERRDLTEEDIERLSGVLGGLKKGQMVRARYYDRDAYVTREGVVTRIDPVAHELTVVTTVVRFEDLLELEALSQSEDSAAGAAQAAQR